jgi:hypothetical protein
MSDYRKPGSLQRWFVRNPMRLVLIEGDRVTVNGEKVMMMATFLQFVRLSKAPRLRKWVKRVGKSKCPECGR